MNLTVRVIGQRPPSPAALLAQACGARSPDAVLVGLQRGEAVVDAVPGYHDGITFDVDFRVAPLPEGRTNFLGPYAKGGRADRFHYLSWVTRDAAGGLSMFQRLKVPLSQLPWETVHAAVAAGLPLTVRIDLTDKRGRPRAGSARAEGVWWER